MTIKTKFKQPLKLNTEFEGKPFDMRFGTEKRLGFRGVKKSGVVSLFVYYA